MVTVTFSEGEVIGQVGGAWEPLVYAVYLGGALLVGGSGAHGRRREPSSRHRRRLNFNLETPGNAAPQMHTPHSAVPRRFFSSGFRSRRCTKPAIVQYCRGGKSKVGDAIERKILCGALGMCVFAQRLTPAGEGGNNG